MTLNPKNILQLLNFAFDHPMYDIESKISDSETSFAEHLIDIIKDAINNEVYVDTLETLCFYENSVANDEAAFVEDDDINDEFNESFEKDSEKTDDVDMEYKKNAVDFWRSAKTKRRSLNSVQHKFKKVKDAKQLFRWEKQIANKGVRKEKLQYIANYVLQQFQRATEQHLAVHDIDLKRWSLIAREEVDLSTKLFSGSSKWIHNFKKRNGIVSRKINKFVTKAQIANKEELLKEASKFVEHVKLEISRIGASNVYNSDQSGFNLESHAGRTLAISGTLKVECVAQSLNSLTHSYTIQPIISADGILKSPLLIILQEKEGQFGPLVEKGLYKAENILALASTSGKSTSKLTLKWFEDIFLLNAGNESGLCLDSWTGQKEKIFDDTNKGTKKVKVHIIPAGATGFTQPLDVYGFRPWKNFLKHFSDLVILYNYDINLHLRNTILKTQSLIHNQFSSPRFVNLFKYAWWKSGYISEKPDKFPTPVQYCFKNVDAYCKKCNDMAVIKCAWCTIPLCMQHFFSITGNNSPHYCKKYIK